MPEKRNEFGHRLAGLRLRAKLSVYALSKKSGITQPAIARLERGEREPAWGTVVALAAALGVSLAAFDTVPPDDQDGESPQSANANE